jgi:hypothetical protein
MGVQLRQSVTVEAGHIARAPRSRTRFWLEFLARRILRLSILLFGVALVAFALAKFSPINPVDAYLGPSVIHVSPEQRELIAQRSADYSAFAGHRRTIPTVNQLLLFLSRTFCFGAANVLEKAPRLRKQPMDKVVVAALFELMRFWHDRYLGFEQFLSPDQLHMNDWSYGCLADALAYAIGHPLLPKSRK